MPANKLEDIFPLHTAPRLLEGFRLPRGEHSPTGSWALSYDVLTLVRQGAVVGRLRLQRETVSEGCRLHVRYERPLIGGGIRVEEAKILCAGDVLATPRTWTLEIKSTDRKGNQIPHAGFRKSARVRKSTIDLQDAAGTRQLHVTGRWTLNWALFEAVPRLPKKPFDPLRFTLLDDFDERKPNQVLSYRGVADTELQQSPPSSKRLRTRLHAFQQLGPGIVPWVYWVDEQGRLLFAVSGLEGYALRWRPA